MKTFTACISLLVAFLITACNWEYEPNNYKSFDYNLRGTWVSNETGLYSGTLRIDSDTITIDGYGEDWTSMLGDDSKRPFKDFPKRVPLKGYSEEEKIFIKYAETALEGIPYVYTELGTYTQKYKLLEFSFGGRKEILQWTKDS